MTTTDDHVDDWIAKSFFQPMPTRAADHLARCERCRYRREGLAVRVEAQRLRNPGYLEAHLRLLLRQLDDEAQPFELAQPLAEFFGVQFPKALQWLSRALTQRTGRWQPGPAPGIRQFDVECGLRFSGAKGTCVRMAPSAVFPRHIHESPEHVLIVQGGTRDEDGSQHWRGELQTNTVGTRHSPVALEGADCVAFVRVDPPV